MLSLTDLRKSFLVLPALGPEFLAHSLILYSHFPITEHSRIPFFLEETTTLLL